MSDSYVQLTDEGGIPDNLDWDWKVQVHVHPDQPTAAELKISQESWEEALYYDNGDFRDFLEDGSSQLYHERLNGRILIAYRFHRPRLGPEDRIILDGLIHPATEDAKGDYNTYTDECLLEATLIVSLENEATRAAVREFMLDNGHTLRMTTIRGGDVPKGMLTVTCREAKTLQATLSAGLLNEAGNQLVPPSGQPDQTSTTPEGWSTATLEKPNCALLQCVHCRRNFCAACGDTVVFDLDSRLATCGGCLGPEV